jgi:hypothetical protein
VALIVLPVVGVEVQVVSQVLARLGVLVPPELQVEPRVLIPMIHSSLHSVEASAEVVVVKVHREMQAPEEAEVEVCISWPVVMY